MESKIKNQCQIPKYQLPYVVAGAKFEDVLEMVSK
jgi:hypothetical protein